MPNRDYYLRQAKLLFDMAAGSTDPEMVARCVKRANEYQMLADAMPDDAMPDGDPPSGSPGVVQQPMQQQQAKSDDEG